MSDPVVVDVESREYHRLAHGSWWDASCGSVGSGVTVGISVVHFFQVRPCPECFGSTDEQS